LAKDDKQYRNFLYKSYFFIEIELEVYFREFRKSKTDFEDYSLKSKKNLTFLAAFLKHF